MIKTKYILFLALLIANTFTAAAQESAHFIGSWAGKLDVGGGLRIVFHIKDNGSGGLRTTADSPDQSAFGMKCDTTFVAAGTLTIEIREVNASYTARLQGDSALDGVLKQGMELPLILKKAGTQPTARKRPQQPVPPFPYKIEDVEYDNADRSLHYGATITIPDGKGPFPAVVLISGSGAQNRDGEMMGHKSFVVLGDALSRNGFVVLRVDDRGVGKSSGRFSQASSADFADDVRVSLDYLLSRPEVDRKKTGLLGHSEGGMIAPIAAAQRNDIDFIVLLGAPGIKISELMEEQNRQLYRQAGMSQRAIDAYMSLYKATNETVMASTDTAAALKQVRSQIKDWAASTDTSLLRELKLDAVQSQDELAKGIVGTLSTKWYRYFLAFDPAPYLQKLKCKVLALNGEKDVQVVAGPNLAGIEAALKKSKSKTYEVKQLPGLNHLFQTCRTCTPSEYAQLEETFSPLALDEINKWLNKNVK